MTLNIIYVESIGIVFLGRGLSKDNILYYKIQSVCVSVCEYVSMLVQNRLLNHAYYGHEAFAGDSVG